MTILETIIGPELYTPPNRAEEKERDKAAKEKERLEKEEENKISPKNIYQNMIESLKLLSKAEKSIINKGEKNYFFKATDYLGITNPLSRSIKKMEKDCSNMKSQQENLQGIAKRLEFKAAESKGGQMYADTLIENYTKISEYLEKQYEEIKENLGKKAIELEKLNSESKEYTSVNQDIEKLKLQKYAINNELKNAHQKIERAYSDAIRYSRLAKSAEMSKEKMTAAENAIERKIAEMTGMIDRLKEIAV